MADLRPLYDAGVFGFKCFLLHSGVDEFPPLEPDQLEAAMREIASLRRPDDRARRGRRTRSTTRRPRTARRTPTSCRSRPRGAENLAIAQVIELARWTGCRVHILHLSSSDALPMIATARRDGIGITAETCPHYLTFAAEEIPDGATQFKCCPPIREAATGSCCGGGCRRGHRLVVSDHSPSTVDLKCLDIGDFGVAWGGIASLQLGLSAVWTEARQRGFDLADVSDGCVRHRRSRPAWAGRAGSPSATTPTSAFSHPTTRSWSTCTACTASAITPMRVARSPVSVRSTWLRGKQIDIDDEPQGRLLNRGAA